MSNEQSVLLLFCENREFKPNQFEHCMSKGNDVEIDTCRYHYYDRARTSWLSVRIMCQVMVLAAWVFQWSHHECALSPVGTHPDMTQNVARTEKNNEQTKFATA